MKIHEQNNNITLCVCEMNAQYFGCMLCKSSNSGSINNCHDSLISTSTIAYAIDII